jgi:hypothetical protein
MPALSPFDYAVVRVVPQVERGEYVNAGVVLFCRPLRFLGARMCLHSQRLLALAPDADVARVQEQLDLIPRICAGGAAAGPIGQMSEAERFHWLVSPRSTTVQISPVHCGLCHDPQVALDGLFARLVD